MDVYGEWFAWMKQAALCLKWGCEEAREIALSNAIGWASR